MKKEDIIKEVLKAKNSEIFIAYVVLSTGDTGYLTYETTEDFLKSKVDSSDLFVTRVYIGEVRYNTLETIDEIRNILF